MKPLIREIGKGEGREARIRELKLGGMRPTDIARTLGIGRSSVYEAELMTRILDGIQARGPLSSSPGRAD
jgi:hypothetical protein